jgi:hypothetical protein
VGQKLLKALTGNFNGPKKPVLIELRGMVSACRLAK